MIKTIKKLLLVLLICFTLMGIPFTLLSASAEPTTFEPGLVVLSAKQDLHVVIYAHGFPAFSELQVTMQPTDAASGSAIEISTVNAEESGSFFSVLHLPVEFIGEESITVHLEGIKSRWAVEETFANQSFTNDAAIKFAKDHSQNTADQAAAALASPALDQASAEGITPNADQDASSLAADDASQPESDGVSFIWPATKRWLSGYDFSEVHPGIDIAAKKDEHIFAAANGKVIAASFSDAGYGNMVMIEHDNGYRTLYAHLNAILVSRGSYVVQGQPIGQAGSTGNSTGPHLHFEIRYKGQFVNPWLFFDR